MFDNMFQALTEQQRPEGAVDHPEFEVSHGIGAVKLTTDERDNLEAFVVSNTTEAHRYMNRDGQQGIVYYDRRGRGAMCTVEGLPDEELMWLAQSKGWKKAANPDAGDAKGGYDHQEPIEEDEQLAEGLKTRKQLFEKLRELSRGGLRVDLPSKVEEFRDWAHGKKVAVYVDWHTTEDKEAGEWELTGAGFKIAKSGDKKSTSSMVPVAYYKSRNAPDHTHESEIKRVLAEARGEEFVEQIQVINPYAANMWVIRFEDYLYRITDKKKWKWKKPILRSGSNELRYKWVWARKKRGSMFSPIVELKIHYDAGQDLFDVTVTHYDEDSEKIREKKMRGMFIGDVTDPDKMLGWMRRS